MKGFRTSAVLLLAAGCGAAQAASVTPHRAFYDVSLDTAQSGGGLRSADGKLGFEIQDAGCDGWTVNFRMANSFASSEGPARLVDTQSTTYESRDGTRLDYAEKTYANNKLDSETRLQIARESKDVQGKGDIKLPEAKAFTLEKAAKFPMQHQLHMMDLAAAGETHDASVVFDGSDGDKAMKAITFIGKLRAAGQDVRGTDAEPAKVLTGLKSWPVTVSYFDSTGDNPDVPSYTVSFDLFENGVAAGLKMDYGTFKLVGRLKNLEMLPKESCN